MEVFNVKTQSIWETFIEHISIYIIGVVWPSVIRDRYSQETEFSNVFSNTAEVEK